MTNIIEKHIIKNLVCEIFKVSMELSSYKMDGGSTDHIDLWNGVRCIMKAGGSDYFAKGKAVWFWKLSGRVRKTVSSSYLQ